MCRNIKPLVNFDPPASEQEIYDAALQFVRKVSGMHHPSQANEAAFNKAIDDITHATYHLLSDLVVTGTPKDREVEAAKARERNIKRFGK